jgi:predicted Ser/Thr protein kinase
MTEAVNAIEGDDRLTDILLGYLEAADSGDTPDREHLLASHPEVAAELEEFFAGQDQLECLAEPLRTLAGTPGTAAPGRNEARSPNAVEAAAPKIRVFGDYELLEEIARGGMGIVFKAQQGSLRRVVALKMILAGQLASPAERQRFRTEAENAAKLEHANIVPIYEVGEYEGYPYFTMKLIQGSNLAESLPALTRDHRAAARLVATAARAVHHAHQRGILHRDLKPANILLDVRGEPYLTDFGLAKCVEQPGTLTDPGALVGTPSYMAPEQASGKTGALTTAADVYSLGAILYELLTGRPAFRGATALDTVHQLLGREPERPRAIDPRIDRDLETICLKCLEKEPQRRFGSAEELAEDLEHWLAGKPIQARPCTAWERVVKWVRRQPAVAALVLVSCLALATLVAGLAVSNVLVSRENQAKETALGERTRALGDLREAMEAERQVSYFQTIALAAPAVLANDLHRADRLLDECPVALRHWE